MAAQLERLADDFARRGLHIEAAARLKEARELRARGIRDLDEYQAIPLHSNPLQEVVVEAEEINGQIVSVQMGTRYSDLLLSDLWGEDREKHNPYSYDTVYLKTASGNIYCIDNTGDMVSADASIQKGETDRHTLTPDLLNTLRIRQWLPLAYEHAPDEYGVTTDVIEIVATNRSYSYGGSYSRDRAADTGRSTIVDEFRAKMQSIRHQPVR